MDVKTFLEEKVLTKLNENPDLIETISAPVALKLDDDAQMWIVDCTRHPATLVQGDAVNAVATILMDTATFESLAAGSLDPQMAFMIGKVKVDGDLGKAIKFGAVLT
ncbi:MAG: sterol-binding protein [Deltaproteobacteria bacterium CG_4_10_14_0_2_um_filter_43_8]|nr:MAG: sterol-binding protein [Deltaproteobacteria bacterium CG_4_10_14_0_2_um_filter_43_8]